MGEKQKCLSTRDQGLAQPLVIETFSGRVQVRFDRNAAFTAFGQMPFFIQFLKTADLFDPWVNECPLRLTSNNAPKTRDVLGTLLLSTLAGHQRYTHVTALRSDGVNPGLLGMTKVASEDSLRRFLKRIPEDDACAWLERHNQKCWAPLLTLPWVLDADTTVKPLYGHQEGAVLGYNPQKPGRPSHVYHSFMMAQTRLVLNVEVAPGNKTAGSHALGALERLLRRIPRAQRPEMFRADSSFGVEAVMAFCEQERLDYLCKLRLTSGVKKLAHRLFSIGEWEHAGQGWRGAEATLRLAGWSRRRRVILLRRPIKEAVALSHERQGRLELAWLEADGGVKKYEYAMLVTTRTEGVYELAQLYRDRGDSENHFDELKNQWGWGGYMTQDLHRCQIMARSVALIYNWWLLFARLARPDKHLEAISSRPLLLHGVGEMTRHAGQKHVSIAHAHGKAGKARTAMRVVAGFLHALTPIAEQLERWRLILSRAFVQFLRGALIPLPKAFPRTG